MRITRRHFVQSTAAALGVVGAGPFAGPAYPQQPALSAIDKSLLVSIENTPWIATPGNAQKPVYIMWAPWCPYCQAVMKDYMAGRLPDIQLRWIGSDPRTPDQRLAIAAVAKANSPDALRKLILREPSSDQTALPETYIGRVLAAELLFVPLKKAKNARGYPTFAYFDGREVATHSGYGGPDSLATVSARAQSTSVTKPQISYLDDVWTDLGAASGRPHENPKGYTIYSLPSENAVAVNNVSKGSFWPVPTKRIYGVRNQKWVSVTTGVRFGNGPEHDGYIRIT